MNKSDKEHWNNIYTHKQPNEVSWTQECPETSLQLIRNFNLPKSAAIIDIGGGESKLVDFLLEDGYENITVLDISEKALERTKIRLGEKALTVQWIVSDITAFKPTQTYDVWHDRAAFHFLTTPEQVQQYLKIAQHSIQQYMVVGTFSDKGPEKCSGLWIQRYNEATLEQQFAGHGFERLQCFTEDHTTPFDTVQHFIFCTFRQSQNKKNI